jgi:hypothetical protein
MPDGTPHGSETDLGPQACKIGELLRDSGYKVYVSKAGRLVVCTGTNPKLDRSAVGTDDHGSDHRAMIRLAQALRIDLPEELQIVPNGKADAFDVF